LKSSLHQIIPFLPLSCSCQFRSLGLVLPPYSAPSSDCALLLLFGTDRTENSVFCCQECLFPGPLHSNGCPIVACARVAGMCLPTRCLAMGINVTLFSFTRNLFRNKILRIFAAVQFRICLQPLS
jgi:hypothetical protein